MTTGKMLVHEIGHYFGLRHIWGDGDCTFDDFIYDTPRGNAASQYNCNHYLNTCVDTIYGIDLPDMVENYMDYSSGNCQNSFTLGQIEAMRLVLVYYRPELPEIVIIESVNKIQLNSSIKIYPNPTTGKINVEAEGVERIEVMDMQGKTIYSTVIANGVKQSAHENEIATGYRPRNDEIDLSQHPKGIYIIKVTTEKGVAVQKVVLE